MWIVTSGGSASVPMKIMTCPTHRWNRTVYKEEARGATSGHGSLTDEATGPAAHGAIHRNLNALIRTNVLSSRQRPRQKEK
jgi:hypothetical protein